MPSSKWAESLGFWRFAVSMGSRDHRSTVGLFRMDMPKIETMLGESISEDTQGGESGIEVDAAQHKHIRFRGRDDVDHRLDLRFLTLDQIPQQKPRAVATEFSMKVGNPDLIGTAGAASHERNQEGCHSRMAASARCRRRS